MKDREGRRWRCRRGPVARAQGVGSKLAPDKARGAGAGVIQGKTAASNGCHAEGACTLTVERVPYMGLNCRAIGGEGRVRLFAVVLWTQGCPGWDGSVRLYL